MKVLTLGYGGLAPGHFRQLVPDTAIVIDVRINPSSAQRFYSQDILAAHFPGRYHSVPQLGNLSRSPARWDPPSPEEADSFITQLAALVVRHNGEVLLLCAERDAQKCHRRFVAKALAEAMSGLGYPVEVQHL
jgi:uncharacterized protein (DUF488 family)